MKDPWRRWLDPGGGGGGARLCPPGNVAGEAERSKGPGIGVEDPIGDGSRGAWVCTGVEGPV